MRQEIPDYSSLEVEALLFANDLKKRFNEIEEPHAMHTRRLMRVGCFATASHTVYRFSADGSETEQSTKGYYRVCTLFNTIGRGANAFEKAKTLICMGWRDHGVFGRQLSFRYRVSLLCKLVYATEISSTN